MRLRLLAALALLAAASCRTPAPSGPQVEVPPELAAAPEGHFRLVRQMMGTFIDVEILEPSSPTVAADAEAAFAAAKRVEDVMNEWKPDSQLSQVNRAAGEAPVKVDADLFDVLAAGKRYGALTNGAFDLTWAAMRGVWKFPDDHKGTPPSPDVIEEKRRLVDYRKLDLDEGAHTAFLEKKGMAIGLGGIAKGYAAGKMAEVLRARGHRNFRIQAGGDMVLGGHGGGHGWTVGIRDPRQLDQVLGTLELADVSVHTSGDYEHWFEFEGRRYHHIIDPRTGMPATGARSVTLIAKDPMEGDALTKAVFIAGFPEGLALAKKAGVEAVIVDPQGGVHATEGVVLKRGSGAP